MPGVSETASPAKLQWGRILLAAILLEATLFAVLVPIGLAFGMPGAGNGDDFTVFFTAVPIGCVVFGYLFGAWTGRRVASRPVMHGTLVGVTAFAIYLAICSIPPNSVATVVAGYGAPLFWVFNALRLTSCVAGAAATRARRGTSSPPR